MTEIDPFSADIIKHRVDEFHKKQAVTPTQAQIEAAARALYPTGRPPSDKACAMAKRALTAAAEAGPPVNVYNSVYQEAIERCAQVVESLYGLDDPHGKTFAAAIRALKDQDNVR